MVLWQRSGREGKGPRATAVLERQSVPAPWTMRREGHTSEDGSKWLARALCVVGNDHVVCFS